VRTFVFNMYRTAVDLMPYPVLSMYSLYNATMYESSAVSSGLLYGIKEQERRLFREEGFHFKRKGDAPAPTSSGKRRKEKK